MYPDLKFQNILETVKYHFDFLFQRGYRITSALFTDANNENWAVIIAGDRCLVKVHYQGETLHISLCSLQLLGRTGFFDLHELIHWMGRNAGLHQHRNPSPNETEQLSMAARLLEINIEEILLLFQKIHLGIAFNKTGELFKDSTPVFSLYERQDDSIRLS